MPNQPAYRSQVLDHLGLVAGMFDELGIGDVIDQATDHNSARRDLTVGEAVNAMVLNGLGFINQALYLVPRFFSISPPTAWFHLVWLPNSSTMMPLAGRWRPSMPRG